MILKSCVLNIVCIVWVPGAERARACAAPPRPAARPGTAAAISMFPRGGDDGYKLCSVVYRATGRCLDRFALAATAAPRALAAQ
ncbi:hypothetical protein RR48_04011 [Papilio machaon]|uniref:Secreted protein n=1 Tax=Papilio machaon TaxID=76193 RepID=A0A0N1IPZ6_PAPMA|nr:hypothetical protein RR48_04011 [Papilio machaon]